MTRSLVWQRQQHGVAFSATEDDALLPVGTWARQPLSLPNGRIASTGPLLHLLEEEKVTLDAAETTLTVPDAVLATLDAWQTDALGLPAHAPVRLTLSAQGTLASAAFRLRYGFTFDDGLPATGASIDGVLFHHGKRDYLLPDPLYTIVARIDAYNAAPLQDMDERFLWWSELAALLPDAASFPSEFFRQMHTVRPDSFSLDFREEGGRLRILPRFVRSLHREDNDYGGELHEDILPAAPNEDFQRRFFGQVHPGGRYALPGNWFVVLPPPLRSALEVVHRINGASESEKRQFLHNPRAAIRERLEAHYGDNAEVVMDSLFQETPLFLSERIKHLGVWEPKGGFYIKTQGGDWFPGDPPPQSLLLPIGPQGALVDVRPADIAPIKACIADAKTRGQGAASYNGTTVSTGDAALSLLERAERMFVPHAPDNSATDGPADNSEEMSDDGQVNANADAPVVPIIFDHIDETGVRREAENLRQTVAAAPFLRPGIALHEHQHEGLAWLQEHWRHSSPGALLADDMGLGKTLQTLAFLAWVRAQQKHGVVPGRPFLIVAPTGLLKNWEEEADKFLMEPGLGPVFRAHGGDLRALMARGTMATAREFENSGLVLTTYETLRDKIAVFIAVHWGVTVFDEAQKIKNPKAMMTDMAKSLKSEFSIALTGTPVENSLADLWCIMDAVHPMRLETFKAFTGTYMPAGLHSTETLAALKDELAKPEGFPSLLRRIKERNWKERPAKHQNPVRITMPPEQAQAYRQALNKAVEDAGRPGATLEALQHIRTIALHPFTPAWGTMTPDAFVNASARLMGTFELLTDIRSKGEKALVFVEVKHMQMILAELLQQRFDCEQVLIINGEVSGPKRQERVHAFQTRKGFDAILLSPKAAGVGLTLTAATHVIHLNRWWNPAVEDQCTDRAYRIGQQHDVTVHYPMAIHPQLGDASFDVKLHELLERKRSLSRDLLTPAPAAASELDRLLADITDGAAHHDADRTDKGEARLLECLDQMEPLRFEAWVAERLERLGFSVQLTPASGDGGADVIATSRTPAVLPSLVIQCKHTQSPERPLGEDGIIEVLRAQKRYTLPGQTLCLLVTNAKRLTSSAVDKAKGGGVGVLMRSDMSNFERGGMPQILAEPRCTR